MYTYNTYGKIICAPVYRVDSMTSSQICIWWRLSINKQVNRQANNISDHEREWNQLDRQQNPACNFSFICTAPRTGEMMFSDNQGEIRNLRMTIWCCQVYLKSGSRSLGNGHTWMCFGWCERALVRVCSKSLWVVQLIRCFSVQENYIPSKALNY